MNMQHYINHISLIVDASSSMTGQDVVGVFDKELAYLKQRSIDLDQETRISIYLFSDKITCLAFDMDVMRFKSLAGFWKPYGNTALLDATHKAITDNQKLPELYGDHAFLAYVITDGEENASKTSIGTFKKLLEQLADNWTIACLVPDSRSKFEAKKFGFPEDSISIWDTTRKDALERVGKQFSSTIDNYMAMRSTGVRGTKSLFTLDANAVNVKALTSVSTNKYDVLDVPFDCRIDEFYVTKYNKPYPVGQVYHAPIKRIKLQDHKSILVLDKQSGKLYDGNVRQQLGLPADTVSVEPMQHPKYDIFVQSTSINRKLLRGQRVLVLKV